MDAHYTYYAGFEKEFKKVTKLYGQKIYYEKNYENEILEYTKDKSYDSDEDINLEEEEIEDELEDDFDNMIDTNKNIKLGKINEIKKNYLFYYHISKRLADEKNKYDCNIIIFDKEINLWLTSEDIEIYKMNNFDCVNIDIIFTYINDFRIKLEDGDYKNPKYKLFINYMEKIFQKDYSQMDRLIKSGKLDYNSLWYYFDKIKSYYIVEVCGEKICFLYQSFTYSNKVDGEKMYMRGIVSLYNKEGNIRDFELTYEIKHFSGKKDIKSFNIEKLNCEEYLEGSNKKRKLNDKNEKIKNLMTNTKYMKLNGKQYIEIKGNMVSIDRDDKVIIDNSYKKIESLLPLQISSYMDYTSEEDLMNINREHIILPFVPIYSLGCGKMWGIAHFEKLNEINFNKTIFDDIVIDKSKKMIVKALLENYNSNVNYNLIDDKGRNLIFLLYGSPGVGKTLTAEASAELLERPLYHITIGDLKLNPEMLESNLEDIDRLCSKWNAILLIDEADIFLEERSFTDISRNTIVSIFLKFLEYSKNIIFLTTNRLDTIDPAIRSRINLIINYPKLREEERSGIWNKVLEKINIDKKKKLISYLSNFELNGREICNIVNIIMTILKSKDENFLEKEIKIDDFKNIFDKCHSINNESNNNIKSQLYM